MTDEIRLEGLGVTPGVLDTIVTLAVRGIDGLAFASSGHGIGGLVNRASGKAAEFTVDDDGAVAVKVHITVVYGTPLMDVARTVQAAIADAIHSQIGARVGAVDVYIDDVEFSA